MDSSVRHIYLIYHKNGWNGPAEYIEAFRRTRLWRAREDNRMKGIEKRVEERAAFLEAAVKRLREDFSKKIERLVEDMGVDCKIVMYDLHAVLFIPEGTPLPSGYEARWWKEFEGAVYYGIYVPY